MIIGFTGGMGSGKSTAIETIKDYAFPLLVKNVKFAQPLYDMQAFIYNRIDSVYTPPKGFIKDRKLLQWLGTEWGRDSIKNTLWIDLWKAEVERIKHTTRSQTFIVVCDDVRFENEAWAVKALGGVVVKLHGHSIENMGIVEHKSESGIPESLVDFSIDNSGSLEEFKQKIVHLYESLKRS